MAQVDPGRGGHRIRCWAGPTEDRRYRHQLGSRAKADEHSWERHRGIEGSDQRQPQHCRNDSSRPAADTGLYHVATNAGTGMKLSSSLGFTQIDASPFATSGNVVGIEVESDGVTW